MEEVVTVGLDIAKSVFQVHAVDAAGRVVVQRKLTRAKLLPFFERLAPENDPRYRHDTEGPDDMPAHIRTALTSTSLSIPVIGGRMALGTWQGIYVFEHRSGPQRRNVVLHL